MKISCLGYSSKILRIEFIAPNEVKSYYVHWCQGQEIHWLVLAQVHHPFLEQLVESLYLLTEFLTEGKICTHVGLNRFFFFFCISKKIKIWPTQAELWRRKWQPTPVFSPGEFCGQRSLVGCCPWGCRESDTTEST